MGNTLSVVIPMYNESKILKSGVLSQINDYFKRQNYSWEVLLVDDGSSDDTAAIAEDFSRNNKGFVLLKEPHRGKGGTVIAGMSAAKGDVILFCDVDLATPITETYKLLAKINEGYDIAIGSRRGRSGTSIVRKLMSAGFVFWRFVVLGLTFRDTQCGFKAFSRRSGKEIFERMKIFGEEAQSGYVVQAGFDVEVLFIARRLGYKIAEVPVTWAETRKNNQVNPIKDSWLGLRDTVRVRINALRGKYEKKS